MNKIYYAIIFSILGALILSGCQPAGNQSSATANYATNDTPAAAYKRLFDAVKSRNTEAIQKTVSKETQGLGEMMGKTYKQTSDQVYRNGFTETTMGDQFPPTRDPRVKDNMAAIQVQNPSGKWEDLPFVLEDGEWKLGVGDQFKGTYKLPAPPKISDAPQMPAVPPTAAAPNPANNPAAK